MKRLFLCLLLVGCSTLTFNEQLGIAQGSVDTITKTTDQLLLAGKITSGTAKKIATDIAYLQAALQAANVAYQANAANGATALNTALTAINTVEGCLAASTDAEVLTCVPALSGS